MNREEAHANVKDWIDEKECGMGGNKWHYGKTELHRDIDKIYDDFESRTCENCKYWEYEGQNDGYCKGLKMYRDRFFGCNEFLRLSNE